MNSLCKAVRIALLKCAMCLLVIKGVKCQCPSFPLRTKIDRVLRDTFLHMAEKFPFIWPQYFHDCGSLSLNCEKYLIDMFSVCLFDQRKGRQYIP